MGSTRKLFVTTDTALDTGTAAATDPSLVGDGSFAVLNAEDASGGSLALTGANATDKMLLVRGGDNPQVEYIEKDKIDSIQVQNYRAEVRQVSAAGFDGVDAGSDLTLVDGEDATIKVTRLEKGYEPFPRITATAVKKTADLPYDFAVKLVEQFRKQSVDNVFGSDTRKFVRADVLADVATTETQASAVTVTGDVVEGSKRVNLSANADTLSAGDYVRIGSATDDQFPVYKVADLTASVITLDRPYAGETESGVALGDGPAPAAGDNVGIKLTAIASSDGDPAISFKTSLDGSIENDNVTSIATPQTGSGLTAQMKNLEEFSFGDRSFYYTNYFPQKPESNVAAGTDYDLLTLIYKNNNDDAVVSQHNFREIHIAYPQGNVTLATLKTFFGF